MSTYAPHLPKTKRNWAEYQSDSAVLVMGRSVKDKGRGVDCLLNPVMGSALFLVHTEGPTQ